MDVGDCIGGKLRRAAEVVGEGREEGVDGVGVCVWSVIEDEVGGEELVVGDLTARRVIAG